MNEDNVYTQWKKHRSQVGVPGHFTANIMHRIHTAAAPNNDEFPVGLTDLPGRLVRWCAAGGLILAGLFRVVFIIANLMRPNLLMP